jgi:tetratricopeptide (TPR) repeat protein
VAAWYACPFESLAAVVRAAPLNTDDLPAVEYRAPRDLYRIGRLEGSGTGAALVPVTGWRMARRLFAGWPPEAWFLGRARQLARSGFHEAALEVASEAEHEGLTDLGRELTAVVQSDRRNRDVAQAQRAAREAAMAGRMEDAREALIVATALDSADARSWVMLADVHRALGDDVAALSAVARAWAVGDSSARSDARVVQGLLEMGRGRAGNAARAFREAALLKPRAEYAWLLEARTLSAAGDTVGAAETCRRGIAAADSSPRLRALLAELGGER